ncbi:MAG: hypothetical protein V3W19_14540 [Desulfatiglandales bacterium]
MKPMECQPINAGRNIFLTVIFAVIEIPVALNGMYPSDAGAKTFPIEAFTPIAALMYAKAKQFSCF